MQSKLNKKFHTQCGKWKVCPVRTKIAIFVEGLWPEFYARGRFMKYSMSVGIRYGLFQE